MAYHSQITAGASYKDINIAQTWRFFYWRKGRKITSLFKINSFLFTYFILFIFF